MDGRLTDNQRFSLIVLAESLVPKENILSLCAFGPMVSGYGSDISDNDLIIVTKDFTEKAVDVLGPGSIGPTPSIVDGAVLLDAAVRATLDETVIGMFLNVYEPLLNEEFLRIVDTAYKKRIMAEKLIEIQADYGDFSSNLILPYEYFLFDQLHKKALENPDLIDSYGHIYSGGQKRENLEFAIRGFHEAAGSLASNGILNNVEGCVTIMHGKEKRKNALRLLYKIHPRTTGGILRNAMHSVASIAGIEYKSKPLSKLKIMEKIESTIELDRPNKLLRLEEGVIFDDPSKVIEEVALLYGFSGTYEHAEEKKGGLINSSTQLKLSGGGREAKFILKHFPELKNVKWVLLNVWSFAAKRFNMTPLSRLNREVEAVQRLHLIGIKTHRITGVVLDERTLVSEYVTGEPLDKSVKEITSGISKDMNSVERYAQALGKMHKAGLVYGDTKPANALVRDDGIYLIDLEQAVEHGNPSWDLAEFLYYSAKDSKDNEGLRLVAESFLAAYQTENGGRVIAKTRKIRLMLPFLPFLTPKKMKVIRKALAKYSLPQVPGEKRSTSLR